MAKTSIKAAVRDAVRQDAKARVAVRLLPDGSATTGVTTDSFVNFEQQLGIGSGNSTSTGTYGPNNVTRNRNLVEWMHRGSWIAGRVVDSVADDMTRAGIEYDTTEMAPDQTSQLDQCAASLGVWKKINETIKWGRLYGGAVAVLLVDGQDTSTPFRPETVGRQAFKGLLVLDRWMLEPALEDLVTDMGPELGLPKYYRVQDNAPALRGRSVHHTRIAFRHVGVEVPYQQRLIESLWGISVLERLFDRMIAYDTASAGASSLVTKSYLRTLKVKGLREVIASGGPAMLGLTRQMEMMRRYQGIEGITLVDGEDEFEAQTHGAFSGLSDALMQFGQQLSGAAEIPLTRLFGQSPAGLNATGDNDMRNYYDRIAQLQANDMHGGVVTVLRCIAASEGVTLPPDFGVSFRSLWQLTTTDKAGIAKSVTDTVTAAKEAGLVSDQTALQELRQSSRATGIWSNITRELIDAADDEITPPMGEMGAFDPETGEPLAPQDGSVQTAGEKDGPTGQPGKVDAGKARRRAVREPAAGGS